MEGLNAGLGQKAALQISNYRFDRVPSRGAHARPLRPDVCDNGDLFSGLILTFPHRVPQLARRAAD
jgi:hypothetical protein